MNTLIKRYGIVPLLVLACALVLIASTSAEAADLDNCVEQPLTVRIVMYPTRTSLNKRYAELAGTRLRTADGFATRKGDIHTLHVVKIRHARSDAIETLGHELLHALCGDWHD